MYALSLWWFAPIEAADIICHSASYPISAKSPITLPIPLASNAATFSMSANLGRISPIILCMWDHSPERDPVIPAPLPATEISWHDYGNPPVIMSIPASSAPPLLGTGLFDLCHS